MISMINCSKVKARSGYSSFAKAAQLSRYQHALARSFASASHSFTGPASESTASSKSLEPGSFKIVANTFVNINASTLRQAWGANGGEESNASNGQLTDNDVAEMVKQMEKKHGFKADSVFLVATPSHSVALADYIGKLSDGTEAIGAVVDSLAYGAQRNGISALLLKSLDENNKQLIEVKEAIKLQSDEEQLQNALGKPSARGVRTARNPWTQTQAYLSVSIPTATADQDATISIPLANTIFNAGIETTLLYNLGKSAGVNEPLNRELLSSLHVRLPCFSFSQKERNQKSWQGICTPISSVVNTKSVAPLLKLTTGGPHKITAVKSNMLKKIDNKPAAGFLESCVAIMAPTKPDNMGNPSLPDNANERKVFATVVEKQEGKPEKTFRFQVIAGGGGTWSPRASMLVLDPHAAPKVGDSIEFYLSESSEIYEKGIYQKLLEDNGIELEGNTQDENNVKIVMECAPVLEELYGYQGRSGLVDYPENSELNGVFAFGSEQGFLVEDVKYNVPGEILEIEN